jgi:hypothetical protein
MDIDYGALFRLQECINKFAKIYEEEELDGNCPMIFDSWNCWHPSSPGSIQEQPCPNFPQLGFIPTSNSF